MSEPKWEIIEGAEGRPDPRTELAVIRFNASRVIGDFERFYLSRLQYARVTLEERHDRHAIDDFLEERLKYVTRLERQLGYIKGRRGTEDLQQDIARYLAETRLDIHPEDDDETRYTKVREYIEKNDPENKRK